jgi:hypothetical protein
MVNILRFDEKQISKVLFVTQGVGAAFVAIFLTAYLGGLPGTTVLHSEPTFRNSLFILGIVLLVLIAATSLLAVFSKND